MYEENVVKPFHVAESAKVVNVVLDTAVRLAVLLHILAFIGVIFAHVPHLALSVIGERVMLINVGTGVPVSGRRVLRCCWRSLT